MAYPPFYSTIPTPSPIIRFSYGYTPPSPNPYTSSTSYPNPYGYGYGYSSYYTHEQQPPLPYSQPQPPPPYSPFSPYCQPSPYQPMDVIQRSFAKTQQTSQRSLNELAQMCQKSKNDLRTSHELIKASQNSIKESFEAFCKVLQEHFKEDEEEPEKPLEEVETFIEDLQEEQYLNSALTTQVESSLTRVKPPSNCLLQLSQNTLFETPSPTFKPRLSSPSNMITLSHCVENNTFSGQLASLCLDKIAIPASKTAPPKPPELGTFTRRNGSFTAAKYSSTRKPIAFPRLKPPDINPTPAPPPKPPDLGIQSLFVDTEILCEPARPPPPPKPPDRVSVPHPLPPQKPPDPCVQRVPTPLPHSNPLTLDLLQPPLDPYSPFILHQSPNPYFVPKISIVGSFKSIPMFSPLDQYLVYANKSPPFHKNTICVKVLEAITACHVSQSVLHKMLNLPSNPQDNGLQLFPINEPTDPHALSHVRPFNGNVAHALSQELWLLIFTFFLMTQLTNVFFIHTRSFHAGSVSIDSIQMGKKDVNNLNISGMRTSPINEPPPSFSNSHAVISFQGSILHTPTELQPSPSILQTIGPH